jgi:hypothetical protein
MRGGLLHVAQRDLADLLQVVLDRVGGRARDGHLGGRQVIVVVTEDEDLLVLASGLGGRPARLRIPQGSGPVGYFQPVRVAGRVAGRLGDIADVAGEDGERGLEAGVETVEAEDGHLRCTR